MFDVTVGVSKKFEQLPEDKWFAARLTRRSVIKYDGVTYKESTEDLLKRAYANLKKAESTGDDLTIKTAWEEFKKFQFQFWLKPLVSKTFANYLVKGNTGIIPKFVVDDGTYQPNKLALWYVALGGKQADEGKSIDVDSVVGNYAMVQVTGKKNQATGRVYQNIAKLREITDSELAEAKVIEVDIKKVEDEIAARDEARRLAEIEAGSKEEAGVGDVTQTPVLEKTEGSEHTAF